MLRISRIVSVEDLKDLIFMDFANFFWKMAHLYELFFMYMELNEVRCVMAANCVFNQKF